MSKFFKRIGNSLKDFFIRVGDYFKDFFPRIGRYFKNLFAKHPNKIRMSKLDRFLAVLNVVLLVLFSIVILFPILSYFALAFSDSAFNYDIVLFPKGWTLWAFKYMLTGTEGAYFWRSFLNSLIITVVVTIGSNLVEAMAAYPLSKKDCPFRSGIMMFFIITMLFSAGIVPAYLLMEALNLTNTIWSIILISISNVTNLLFFKTFFEGLPADIEEAAKLDGATDLQMFFKIVIPMSLPVFGSCCFFTIVGTWNSYGSALMFIATSAKDAHPLAYYIYLLLSRNELNKSDPMVVAGIKNLQSAAMLLSTIPILCIYPYVIKYIKGGLTLGSVKG